MTAKPIDALCAGDLVAHPIWEYATDSEEELDETFVRPLDEHCVPIQHNHAVYHVACDIFAPTGKKLLGFMSISNGELHDHTPIVVGPNRDEYFCLDHPPHRRNRAAYDSVIGVPYEVLLPVRWTLRALVSGEATPRSGVFAGTS